MKNFNFTRVTLSIVTLCSIATFYGVWKILISHNRSIAIGAKTDIGFTRIVNDLDYQDRQCQDRLKVLEEQVNTLYEYNELYHGNDKPMVHIIEK